MDREETVEKLSQLLQEYQWAKRSPDVRRIREKYKALAEMEIEKYLRDKEGQFLIALREAHDAGLPGQVIRNDVLRTNSWDRWVKVRDKAGIEPVREPRTGKGYF